MGTDNGDKKPNVEGKFQPNGMPDMSGEKSGGFMPMIFLVAMVFIVPVVLGLLIAAGIYKYGRTAAYDANMKPLIAKDMHWVYLAVVVLGRCVAFVNMYPMTYKSKIMGFKAGNLRANMYFYKIIGEKAPNNAVALEDTGDVGAYNRANRSVNHMVENFGAIVAGLGLVGAVFPFPMLVLTCLFSAGRIMHQVGYTTGYGGHGAGFMVSNLIASNAVEGLCLLVALKGLGVAIV